MSRLIVKNLPAYLDEARLKQHFGAHSASALTDVKVVRRPDGTSRRFGFVGFKENKDAQAALEYFDRTFIDTARINVSIAKAINDDGLQAEQAKRRGRMEEQYTVEPTTSTTTGKASLNAESSDTKERKKGKKAISFEEFMDVMKPKSKRKAWSNENAEDADAQIDPHSLVNEEESIGKKKRKVEVLKEKSKASTAQHNVEPNIPDPIANDEGLTDLEYMYKRMKRNVDKDFEVQEEKQFDQSDEENSEAIKLVNKSSDTEEDEAASSIDEADFHRQERRRKALEDKARKDQDDTDSIMQGGRLFVRNLPFEATEQELEDYFSRYGEITQAHIALDKDNKKSKGIAFVTYQEPAQALAAFRAADGHTFQGRLLHILPAVQKGEGQTAATVRDKKRQSLKANAAKDFNWSTLYMNSDAVASSVAARLGIDKADIVNPAEEGERSSSTISPAVRLALAETSVINETRNFLEEEGINLSVFEGSSDLPRRRSDTVILVKNIPFGTDAGTLQAMFEKYGAVERTVVPPSGTIAIVEMQVPGEAKIAFKALAYKRLGNSVLYLEKAPSGIMSGSRRPAAAAGVDETARESAAHDVTVPQQDVRTATDATAADGATLYIKNLSFSTTEERLAAAFDKVSDVTFVRIQKRKASKRDGQGSVMISMGYGFVGFRTVDAARAAQKLMNKVVLDGHVLSITMARRGHDAGDDMTAESDAAATDRSDVPPSSKLIVKNLAFQATKKDVRALFAAHGKLKSVRVPRKGLANGGGTATGVRGFGFVEFVNRNEAMHAYRALRHSHLLGRHLVLEWDTEGGGISTDTDSGNTAIERLRRKAAQSVAASAASAAGTGAHRRDRLRLGEDDIRQAARDEQRRMAEEEEDEDEDEGGET